jgi:hypothetical protein
VHHVDSDEIKREKKASNKPNAPGNGHINSSIASDRNGVLIPGKGFLA